MAPYNDSKKESKCMCGIVGIYNLSQQKPIDAGLLKRMNQRLIHRGPDEEGFYVNGSVGLAMRRLSIIDLQTGHQPMQNEDGSLVVVFNGEIYNYQEIKKDLEAKGHVFRTHSDTEVIVHAYEEYGHDCVLKFNGMFAIALWDKKKEHLLIFRDRLGEKPLYYIWKDGAFYFSSEIKSFLELQVMSRAIDPLALYDFISLRYVPGPRTIFKDVKKLSPGCMLVVEKNGLRISSYWRLPARRRAARLMDEEGLTDEFLSLFADSVKLRMVSDVPLGAFLSGGLDSSSVVAFMAKALSRPVETFSVGFQGHGHFDELPFSKIVARHFRTNHHEIMVTPEIANVLPKIIWHLDEPLADPAVMPTYYLAKVTREFVKVALSGEGADELFLGYEKYVLDEMIRRINRWRISGLISPFIGKKRISKLMRMPEGKRWQEWDKTIEDHEKGLLFGEYFSGETSSVFDEFALNEKAGSRDSMIDFDIKVWLPDDLLMKVDKMSMAWSLESRVPFLDHRLVEFAYCLPYSLKIRGWQQKYLFRKSMGRILPPEIQRRKKHGFSVPIELWLKQDLREMMRDLLLNSSAAKQGIWNQAYIETLVGDFLSGKRTNGRLIWNIFIFELWYRVFITNEITI